MARMFCDSVYMVASYIADHTYEDSQLRRDLIVVLNAAHRGVGNSFDEEAVERARELLRPEIKT